MKNLIFAVLILFSLQSLAQESESGFKVDDGSLVWQKIYITNLSFDQLCVKIKEDGLFDKYDITDNKFQGDIKPFDIDFKGAGGSSMGTSMYITRSRFSGFVTFEFQPGKYRVSLKRILLTQIFTDPLTKQGEQTKLELFSIRNNKIEMKPGFVRTDAPIIEYTFNKIFAIKEPKQGETW